jgi:Glycine rich protein
VRGAFSALIVAAAAALVLPAPPAQALVIKVFPYTGAEQTFAVPAGVHKVTLGALGGRGGATADAAGGDSVAVIGKVGVVPAETLYIEVGGDGKPQAAGGTGGFNGGGSASKSPVGGGGGGGASDVRTTPLADGLYSDTRLIVSAGGGGAGGSEAGHLGGGGGAAGEDGQYAPDTDKLGGEKNAGGEKGGLADGGVGGHGCFFSGGEGGLALGGLGGLGEGGHNGGGGGGGGLYGGGGGGGGCIYGGGGGGGGSNLVPPGGVKFPSMLDPRIEIAYLKPPTIDISSPVAGGSVPQGQALTASYTCSSPEGVAIDACSGSVANGAALDTSTLGPHTLTVKAEDAEEGTASASATYTVVAPTPPAPKTAPPPRPDTTITAHPKKTVKTKETKTKVKFGFSSDQPGATFRCKLDKSAFARCTSPKSYRVKPGKHSFSVEAVAPGGSDVTPATFNFKVKKKK